jgi:hypothetical protein
MVRSQAGDYRDGKRIPSPAKLCVVQPVVPRGLGGPGAGQNLPARWVLNPSNAITLGRGFLKELTSSLKSSYDKSEVVFCRAPGVL